MPLLPDELIQARLGFGKRVRELREDACLTQERLAELADLDRKTIYRLELGQYSPVLDNVFEIAAALGRPAVDLFPTP